MAKDDQEESLEKILSAALMRVVDFIKFAETKNAALLTFSSLWAVALVNLLVRDSAGMEGDIVGALHLSVGLFVASALICLSAFLPTLKWGPLAPTADERKNLLFFGDIASLGHQKFQQEVLTNYKPPEGRSTTERYVEDICLQIAVNSAVANRKFKLFNRGAGCAFAAIAILGLPFLWRGIAWPFQ